MHGRGTPARTLRQDNSLGSSLVLRHTNRSRERMTMRATAHCLMMVAGLMSCSRTENNSAGKKIATALIAKSSTNPAFLAARPGAETAAKELSAKDSIDVTVSWLTPPQEDAEMQAQRIRQAVNDGAGAVLISCPDGGQGTRGVYDTPGRGSRAMAF